MTAFLGVPILLRGVAYGNLYLTDKAEGADFTEADLDGAVFTGAKGMDAVKGWQQATNREKAVL